MSNEFSIKEFDGVFLRYSLESCSKLQVWFIHGFPESGLCFKEAFSSKLREQFDLYVPDVPGFGVSTIEGGAQDPVDFAIDKLLSLIKSESQGKKIGIVSHSWGGIISQMLIKKLGDQVVGYIDIEGPLSPSEYFFEEKARDPNLSAHEFATYYYREQESRFEGSEAFKRYYASIRFADPDNLLPWVRSCLSRISGDKIGEDFLKIKCPKSEFWGEQNFRVPLKKFVDKSGVANVSFSSSRHWPMIDETEKFYGEIRSFFVKQCVIC